MDVVKMKELIQKGAHNGLAESHAPNPVPEEDKGQDHTKLEGELESMLERVCAVVIIHLLNMIYTVQNYLLKNGNNALNNHRQKGKGQGEIGLERR